MQLSIARQLLSYIGIGNQAAKTIGQQNLRFSSGVIKDEARAVIFDEIGKAPQRGNDDGAAGHHRLCHGNTECFSLFRKARVTEQVHAAIYHREPFGIVFRWEPFIPSLQRPSGLCLEFANPGFTSAACLYLIGAHDPQTPIRQLGSTDEHTGSSNQEG